MRWGPLVAWGAVAFAVAGLFALLSGVDLSAVRPPGRAEEEIRTKFTRAVVRRRSARENIPFPPPDYQTGISIARGKRPLRLRLRSCHGPNGTDLTPAGRGMSPALCRSTPPLFRHTPSANSFR